MRSVSVLILNMEKEFNLSGIFANEMREFSVYPTNRNPVSETEFKVNTI